MFASTVFAQNEAVKLKTPQTEVEDAVAFLAQLPEKDQSYIKFLSTYAISPAKRSDAVLCASFVLHSMIGPSENLDVNNAGAYYPLAIRKIDATTKVATDFQERRVPDSETLWWLDIRDYNWTEQAWEAAAELDAYFAEPIVQHATSGALRLLGGNAVLRMDWFIVHATDTTKQLDIDEKNLLYNTFLFAQVKPPTTIDEYRKYFTLDVAKSRQYGNEFGTLVTKSKIVSRHNRMLFGYKTEYGYWYDTYDVKNQEGLRDYAESFFKNPKVGTPPPIYDAGEAFGSNIVGLQVYALYNGQDKLVEFGDPTVVRHIADVTGDVRVRVAHSCYDCHTGGPLPSENTIAEFIKAGGSQYFKSKADENRTKRVFSSKKFEDSIVENQLVFKNALEKVNGLTPEENGRIYLDIVKSYQAPIDLKRAAFECGVSEKEFIDKVIKGNFGFRLKQLVINRETIPVDIWESRGKDGIPGQFQQAMILLHGLTKITETEEIVEHPKYRVKVATQIMSGRNILAQIPSGTVVDQVSINGQWVEVNMNNVKGYIKISDLELIK